MIPPTYGGGAHIPGAYLRAGLGSFRLGRSRVGAREQMGELVVPDDETTKATDPGDTMSGVTDDSFGGE